MKKIELQIRIVAFSLLAVACMFAIYHIPKVSENIRKSRETLQSFKDKVEAAQNLSGIKKVADFLKK